MLTSFAVSNYRSFADPTWIELRPLTLLFGYNNVGKSALLRVLPLIAESLLDTGRSPLKVGAASRGGSFEDLVWKLKPGEGLDFELGWNPKSSFGVKIRHLPDLYRQIVWELRASSGEDQIKAQWIPEKPSNGRLGSWYEMTTSADLPKSKAHLEFTGLLPSVGTDDERSELFKRLRADLRQIAGGVQWVSSLRAAPERTFKPGGAPPAGLEPDGSGFQDVLFFDKVDRGGLLEEVSGWFEQHFDQVVDIHEVGSNAYLSLSPLAEAGLKVPLADTGEGMAQVLPILVALAMARRDAADAPRLLALEQPELHLHPAAEIALGQGLAEIVSTEKPPTLLVETHSENLMLSIQLQIARGNLSPDAVALYWVERFENGRSLVRRIEIDEKGRTALWPEGVFSEDINLARQLFLVRQEMRKP